jgi:hypothetical protein
LPAMVVNDNAGVLVKRGALETIASKPAPTPWALHPSESCKKGHSIHIEWPFLLPMNYSAICNLRDSVYT